MSFARDTLARLVAAHGTVARVVVADVLGSAPREVGAAMVVWPGGQDGTMGGGALEFEAAKAAVDLMASGRDRLDRIPLGPAMGQCCGGAVVLLTEIWDAARLEGVSGDVIARPGPEAGAEMPLAVHRVLNAARAQGARVDPALIDGWMVEPVDGVARTLWIYGAGHVGRALVDVLAPLPDLAITWVDTGAARFPDTMPDNVTPLVAANPADAVRHAPNVAEHLVLTYSHALDLEICHGLLSRGFARAGLIGSATKWARFRRRLMALGHSESSVARITCPIGDPALGKHPQAIAIGVARDFLAQPVAQAARKDGTA